ncbi:FAD-dependent oxidoreductase [Sneathiella sp. HT1-7]|uniref:FAD-dependent oxidoreductase n=1 Tax=Sneathiella sp. HT1-7 TaxID=2887192 RepID=UPI001D13D70B|nr:FAD-dependent oxidoreductase [Sneathiella sp. HT1-7]MCC3304038.1 FAD-dependent oxidoreductase [Sneathiella sp. HT1-7]
MHYQNREYSFETPPELKGETPGKYPVAIVGAGPIGMAMAIDLALQGIRTVILDDNNVVSVGSRAICWAKRTLEIFDRLGIGDKMLEKGVTWKVGRLFNGQQEVYNFDLLPDDAHKMPAFVNLQQYYVEEYLVDRIADFPDLIDLRWLSKVAGEDIADDEITLHVETAEGNYDLAADYVLACDGCNSQIRQRMGLNFDGQTFEEHFLITDVDMPEAPFESDEPERWFWFKPPFHTGQSALLHKQPDNIYRIDLQLEQGADPAEEAKPERVIPRLKQIVGDRAFEIDWVSVYSFTCAMLDKFVHGRMIFVGDSAHVVSPFGARGGNGGIQDVDNLGWKLAAVLKGEAAPELLESYDEERRHGARENIMNSSRATNFMTPKSKMEAVFRDAVLNLANDLPFARRLVNSGRLSVPCALEGFALQSPRNTTRGLAPGTPCPDAPLENGWLLNKLGGEFMLLTVGRRAKMTAPGGVKVLHFEDHPGVTAHYGDDMIYLIRPDQHIAAAFEAGTGAESLKFALARAIGKSTLETTS